jgi:hypothetical protein
MIAIEEPLVRAFKKATQDLGRDFLVENPVSEDDFPHLLKMSGLVDINNSTHKWRKEWLEPHRGYSKHTHYRFKWLSPEFMGWDVSSIEMMSILDIRMFMGQATTRELVAFFRGHKDFTLKQLKSGKKFVALGKDLFNLMGDTPSMIVLNKGRPTLTTIENFYEKKWDGSYLFLSRISNRS